MAWAHRIVAALVLAAAGLCGAVPALGAAVPTLVARPDSVTTTEGTPVTFDVQANDTVPAGSSYDYGMSAPFHGMISSGSESSPLTFTYTPDAGYLGSDGFTYEYLQDGQALASASVSITVTAAVTTTRTTTTTTTRRTTTTSRTTTSRATTGPARTSAAGTTTRPTTEVTTAPVVGDPPTTTSRTPAPTTTPAAVGPSPSAVPSPVPTPGISPLSTATPDPIGLDEPSAAPEGTVALHGHGCPAGSTATVGLDGTPVATVRAASDGTFEVRLRAPGRIGRHRLTAVCGRVSHDRALDVVLTTSTGAAVAAPVAGAATVVVGGVMSFYLLTGFLLVPRSGSAGSAARRPDAPWRGWSRPGQGRALPWRRDG